MRETLKVVVVVVVIAAILISVMRYFRLEERMFGYSITDYSYHLLKRNYEKIPQMLDAMRRSAAGGADEKK
jgi:hypothetical protein